MTHRSIFVQPRLAAVTAALIALATFSVPAHADLIKNGGFELPDVEKTTNFTTVTQGIPNWTIVKGAVQIKKSNLAYQGDQYLALNGLALVKGKEKFVGGTISQTFKTLKNSIYELFFAYANTPYSTAGAFVSVSNSTFAKPFVVSHSGAGPKNLNWSIFSQDFTALSNTATLTFSYDPAFRFPLLIDAVSVTMETSAVPEPGSIALLATVFGLIGLVMFRRRAALNL